MHSKNIKFFLFLAGIICGFTVSKVNPTEETGQLQPTDSIKTVSFAAVGDIMCHSTQFNYARVSSDSFDFKPGFRNVKKIFDTTDVVIGNLETVTSGPEKSYDGYPVFNTPDDFLEGLQYAGFDFLITSNNHATDGKKEGLLRTIEKIKEYGMKNVGTFASQQSRDSIHVYERNGITFTILAYTYGVNIDNLSSKEKYLINKIDSNLIKIDLLNARIKNPDLILVYFHYGYENHKEPNEYQKDITNLAIDYGADIILGASPHVVQPIEFFESKRKRIDSGFVAYSLGNFISNQRWRYSDGGSVLQFKISKNINSGQMILEDLGFIPTWVYKGFTGKKDEYIIFSPSDFDSQILPDFFSKKDSLDMLKSFGDTKKQLRLYTDKPRQIQTFPNKMKSDTTN